MAEFGDKILHITENQNIKSEGKLDKEEQRKLDELKNA